MSSATAISAGENPYVGPKPFREGDPLYGRNREARDVVAMLMAERILLLHGPSGAGKTSLLQSKVIPILRDEEDFHVSGPLRVNSVPTNGFKLRNRYSWSVIVGITGGDVAASKEFAEMTLTEFLNSDRDPHRDSERRLLVLDQFEEIVTLDPGDREQQAAFFNDLGQALKQRNRWALLSMREDYMGGLAPFVTRIPTHLKVRYRISFLDHSAALEATVRPAADARVTFEREAAEVLVNDLAKVRRQLPGEHKATTIDGPYVEPVQLQAVCSELWRRVKETWGDDLSTIVTKDVEQFGDFDAALSAYYANSAAKVARKTGASERVIRDWFEEKLITEDGWFRNQTQTGPAVDGDVNDVLRELGDQYLIRSDQRDAATWYELTHDRLIDPICADNKNWRDKHLDAYELAAREWDSSDRDEIYLLDKRPLDAAKRWLKGHGDVSALLRQYVATSERRTNETERARRKDAVLSRFGLLVAVLTVIVLAEAVVIVVLLGT